MRSLLAAALLAVTAVALPPAGAAGTPYLVVSGTRSGYVDVTFAKPFEVDTYGWIDTRKGRFGGFWAERIGQPAGETPDQFGVIRITRGDLVATARVAKVPPRGEPTAYAAGRYRIHAVADGPFTLALPVTGIARTIRVSPRVFTPRPRFSAVPATPVPGNPAWEAREPITVGPARSVAISISFVRWRDSALVENVLCVTKTGGRCEENRARVTPGKAQADVGTAHFNTESYFATPGVVPAGKWDAYQLMVTAPGATAAGAEGMALVFDAPAGR